MFTHIQRNVYANITQALRSYYALLRRRSACYADFCMLRRFMHVTQSLRRHYKAIRRHYADITQSLGILPLSDNYAVLRSHYAELRNRYAVLRSVTQCYAGIHEITQTALC